uniref:CYTH domain-containing protein n=1 Tax=Lygus hesperus TaxID=30085 RepID=A0A0A9ZAQ1_LYGHE
MEACRNVEIKARVASDNVLENIKNLCDSPPEVIDQADYFFNIPQGRLKLRSLKNSNKWELIYYDRPDAEGPRLSDFRKVEVEDGLGLLEVLRCSLGIKGEVIKRRLLYMYGQTRIHYDKVENLGTFMELEVVLRKEQTVEEGTAIANDILEKLGISKDDFITCAYMDLISKALGKT